MQLPKQLALQSIVRGNVHHDKKSLEIKTGIVKAKYKLAGTVIPGDGGILFWVLTSKGGSYPSHQTITLNSSDYTWCSHASLQNGNGYACIDRYDYIQSNDIYAKMQDANNGFKHVATVSDATLLKLSNLRHTVKLSNSRTVKELQNIIKATVDSRNETYNEILSNMGLA